MANKPIKISIIGDASKFNKELGDTDSKIGNFINGPVAKIGGAVAGAFAVGSVVDFGGEMFNLGSDLQLLDTKIETVFGANENSVRKWSDEINESLGLSETAVAGMAASTADLLKPMGFSADEAANMSMEMVELSGALSMWDTEGRSAAEVSDIMTKAMLGETDGLKSLGISISAAEVEERALAMAKADGRDEITAQDKALATQALILEKSTDAEAAYADSADSMAGKTNEAKAKFEDLKETIARRLMPIFDAVVKFAVDDLVPAIESISTKLTEFADWFNEHQGPIIAALAGIAAGVMIGLLPAFLAWAVSAAAAAVATIAAAAPIIALAALLAALAVGIYYLWTNWEQIWEWIKEKTGAVWTWIKDTVSGSWESIKQKFSDAGAALAGKAQELWDGVKQKFTDAKTALSSTMDSIKDGITTKASELVSTVVNTITGLPGKILELGGSFLSAGTTVGSKIINGIKDGLSGALGFAGDVASGVWKAVKNGINTNVIDKLNAAIPNTLGKGPFSIDLPDNPIQRLAKGGLITRAGLALVGEHGRELVHFPTGAQVTPARETEKVLAGSGSGGRGGDIYLTANTNADPHEIGREVAWNLKKTGW